MARLLLIDDGTDALAWMKPVLEGEGYEVRLAENAERALRVLEEWRPDLGITDVLLPDLAPRAHRQLVRTHHLPLLFVSIIRGGADAVLRGASGVLRAPVSPARLRAVIATVLGRAAGARNLVLLVDDDENMRELFREMLEADVDVTEATDGVEALAALERHDVHAVITDIHMPHMDGIELVRRLRADERFSQLPVIVVSSDRVASESPVWSELGVDRTMSKHEFAGWLVSRIDERLASTGSTSPEAP